MKRLLVYPVLLVMAAAAGIAIAIDVLRLARREARLERDGAKWTAERVGRAKPNMWEVN